MFSISWMSQAPFEMDVQSFAATLVNSLGRVSKAPTDTKIECGKTSARCTFLVLLEYLKRAHKSTSTYR